ncbi:interferon-inducible GTPase 5-like [Paramormyrops kingsleyae]|uniref:Interferon-inducible GTPase 5-like n=1 Tax=Paramormyrops kingsleyae TaxID=1676925 RepID=A0A3B3Q8N4_9TELE|nr:interferon-inducible GTPase 5-like [Paramormyrops kingsleyae]XP_023660967.1 interferon-inducible GTPase 5-like [Paramormyrops kingsleyae]XP_023660968.1 interferon-inducible GTPase 5-like [Paramormyrops kingsleyae]XP_023660969.1 interferon-inducible GTPase 5-like [Paramormyrops kingsleyae]
MDEFDIVTDEEVQDIREALENGTLATAAEKIQEYFNELDHVTLNIAITGESGSGKSTFVNAFRGIGDDDEINSAPTGVVETTMEPKSYPHPKYPSVQLWDLPGIGTPNFKADTYLQDVEFKRYDFFIIIASERFRSSNVQLAMEIQKMKKRFYFVRSKIDENIRAEKRKRTFDLEKTLKTIRDDCMKGLQEQGLTSPTVFLISSFELGGYDFPLLEGTMEKELPKHKRHVLLLSLPNMTLEINEKKKAALQADIWKMAVLSGTVAAIPIPGLSVAVDVTILVKEISRYYLAFGLDDDSLRKLSDRTDVPFEELKSVLKSPLNKEISADVVIKLLTKAAGGGLMVVEYLVSNIPVFGSMLAGGISFGTTYSMLSSCLNELAQDSHNVLMRAVQTEV